MRRRLDVLNAAARRQILRRDVLPRLAVVARDVEGTIVRARPDHARLELGLADGVKRGVELLARDVARERYAAAALRFTRRIRREVRGDLFPVHAAVLG